MSNKTNDEVVDAIMEEIEQEGVSEEEQQAEFERRWSSLPDA